MGCCVSLTVSQKEVAMGHVNRGRSSIARATSPGMDVVDVFVVESMFFGANDGDTGHHR